MPLTLPDARARARTVREVSYEVHLDLRAEETFVASTTVTFSADAGTATFLDLQHAREVRVWLDGVELPSTHQRQATELIAFLAFNPGSRGSDISKALWPSREPNLATRRSAVSRARRWLGTVRSWMMGDEPYPRHLRGTAVAASFRT